MPSISLVLRFFMHKNDIEDLKRQRPFVLFSKVKNFSTKCNHTEKSYKRRRIQTLDETYFILNSFEKLDDVSYVGVCLFAKGKEKNYHQN